MQNYGNYERYQSFQTFFLRIFLNGNLCFKVQVKEQVKIAYVRCIISAFKEISAKLQLHLCNN